MSQKKSGFWLHLIQIVLAVLVGVLMTLTVIKARENRFERKARYQDWQKLNVILGEVERQYVDTIKVKEMTDAAIVAALHELDPHSVYLPPVELESSEADLAGDFEGIGIQFNVPNDTAIVLEVIAGGPSEKVGLLPGDRILKVDSTVIAGVKFPQDSMVRRMKGPAGTKVKITVKRERETIPFDIIRGKIPMHSIDAYFMLNDTTGYLRLAKFSASTFKEFREASKELLDKGMTRLLFDVRDNSGGYFEQACLLSNAFLEKGDTIVYLEGRHRRREVTLADGHGTLRHVQLTVLVNENSASSSEIFAGAIQDNDRGVIVGRRTFGKGLVQEPLYFSDGSGIRLTVARFYTPSGRCIQKPYTADYEYDIYKRYTSGEVFCADSVKLDSTDIHRTALGRTVYGGGGIMPDVFVPMDTTRATPYYQKCNKKATQMRFASAMFDKYRKQLLQISDEAALERFIQGASLPNQFRTFADSRDGIRADDTEWKKTLPYLEPQLNALVARYSRLGENAFYKYYLPIDEGVKVALEHPSTVR